MIHKVYLPRKFHEQRSLAGYSPKGCKELDPTEHACIHAVKGFSIVNKVEVDFFFLLLEFSSFLHDPTNAGNLSSGSSAFSKPSLYIWKFSVHILLRPSLEDFECNLTSMGSEYNCPVWTFFSTALLGIGMRVGLFQSWGQLGLPNLLTYWV